YNAFRCDADDPLPALSVQYADYAVWQREWFQGEVEKEQLTYWMEQISGLPQLHLPTDKPRPPIRTLRGASESFFIPAEVTGKLKAFCNREIATLFMVLMTAFQILMRRITGQEDIVVGTGVANRSRKETEALIGFFVNILVFRTDLSGNPTVREVLRRVRN